MALEVFLYAAASKQFFLLLSLQSLTFNILLQHNAISLFFAFKSNNTFIWLTNASFSLGGKSALSLYTLRLT